MKKQVRQLISIWLAVLMIFGMLPVSASAETEASEGVNVGIWAQPAPVIETLNSLEVLPDESPVLPYEMVSVDTDTPLKGQVKEYLPNDADLLGWRAWTGGTGVLFFNEYGNNATPNDILDEDFLFLEPILSNVRISGESDADEYTAAVEVYTVGDDTIGWHLPTENEDNRLSYQWYKQTACELTTETPTDPPTGLHRQLQVSKGDYSGGEKTITSEDGYVEVSITLQSGDTMTIATSKPCDFIFGPYLEGAAVPAFTLVESDDELVITNETAEELTYYVFADGDSFTATVDVTAAVELPGRTSASLLTGDPLTEGTYLCKVSYDSDTSVDTNRIYTAWSKPVTVTTKAITLYDTNGETAGGKYSVNPTSAAEGETITITVTPANGYEVDTITVTGTGSTVDVSGTGNTRTFTMPAEAVTVSVTFKTAVTMYDLWVAGVQVTSADLEIDNTDTQLITEGSATYDPKNGVLTLNNFKYSGDCSAANSDEIGAVIYGEGIDLTIKLVGASVIDNTCAYGEGIFIEYDYMAYEGGNLTILDADETNEDPDLIITTVDEGEYCDGISATNLVINGCNIKIDAPATYSYGIGADENLTIADCVVDTNAYFSGIIANYVITIEGSTINAKSNYNAGIIFGAYTGENEVLIEDSIVVSEGVTEGMMVLCENVTIQNSSVTASSNEYGIALGYERFIFGGNCETFKIINSTVTAKGGTAAYALITDDPETNPTNFIIENSLVYAGNTEPYEVVENPGVETYANKYVKIEPAKYTVTVTATPTEGGTVAGGGTYQEGATVTLTAEPNAGYRFVNWTENGTEVSTNAIYSITADTDVTLIANFELNSYTITATANPAGGGSVEGGDTYNHGAEVTLTATPAAGYKFVKWTKGGIEVGTDATYTFAAEASCTLVANFELNVYSITAADTTNGTVTVDPSAAVGAEVTLTLLPEEGYEVDAVTVYKTDDVNTTVQVTADNKFRMPAYNVTVSVTFREIEYTGTVSEEDGTVENVTAGGLGEVAEEINKNIVLTVKVEAADANDTEQTAIKEQAGSRTLEFMDITLEDGSGNSVIVPQSAVLEIAIPFTVGNKQNITVYRYHGSTAAAFTALAAKPDAGARTDGTFYVDSENNKIYIYTNQFSTYAIGYTVPSTAPDSYTPTYAIAVEEAGNGIVQANYTYASSGSTVTVAVTPDKGYVLDKLTVTDSFGREVDVAVKDGKYTFKMPTAKVTVKATFKEEVAFQNPFEDVFATDYYYDAVLWAVKEGITNGTSATTFSPNAPCTRAQMVTFLWRTAGSPEPTATTCSFTDVDMDSYYGKAVLWAVENGITNGTSDTTFSPDMECSRAQMATFLRRMAGGKAESDTIAFTDVKADAYYAESVQWAVENGITNGTGDNKFNPDATCTRGQMVTFLYRYYVNQ